MFLAKSPDIVKKYYSKLIWNIPNNKQKIYLTFDDGPTPKVTEWLLGVLKHYDIKATFFCVGNNVEKHPLIFQRLIDEGHAVGNHTYNHLKGWKTDNQSYLDNVQRCQDVFESNLFRPPYGKIKRSQTKIINQQYLIVMWDVLSGDFDQKTSPEKCLQNVIKHVKVGFNHCLS